MAPKTKSTALIIASTGAKIDRFFKAGLQKLEAEAVEDRTGFRVGIPRRRYREGFTDRSQFRQELQLLRVPDVEIPLEIVAGDLEASYDYTTDLIAVWREAFRKGHIGIERFTELIGSVVVIKTRVQTYVARELARLRPEEVPSLAPVPKQYYETDSGKLDVDTIRRQRRRRKITRDQEIVALLTLGMGTELANSYADNDDERLAKKGEEE